MCGLEKALVTQDVKEIALAVKRIHLQHAIILSLGGLPMIYSGDEIGLTNNYDHVHDEAKKYDNRWLHRSPMDWEVASKLEKDSSAASQIFHQLKHLIALRKQTPAFADNNDFTLIDYPNARLLMYSKTSATGEEVQVVANFTESETHFNLPAFSSLKPGQQVVDLISGTSFISDDQQQIGAYEVMWLKKYKD